MIALILVAAFALQAVMAGGGLIVCRHADGSERLETLAQKSECCGEHGSCDTFASADCTDTLVAPTGVALRASDKTADAVRIAPALMPMITWASLTLDPPTHIATFARGDAHPPADEQQCRALSAIVLIV